MRDIFPRTSRKPPTGGILPRGPTSMTPRLPEPRMSCDRIGQCRTVGGAHPVEAGTRCSGSRCRGGGYGASTRNSGYLGRTMWFKYGDMVKKIGRETASLFAREAIVAHDFAASLIRDEQIACFYRNTGRFIAAPSKKIYEKLERDLEMMKADGVPVEADMIPPERVSEEVASRLYHGGQVHHGNGVIHAGLYHQVSSTVPEARVPGSLAIARSPGSIANGRDLSSTRRRAGSRRAT